MVTSRWRVPGAIFIVAGLVGLAAVQAVLSGRGEAEIAVLAVLALGLTALGFTKG